jgi:hypothetical protein
MGWDIFDYSSQTQTANIALSTANVVTQAAKSSCSFTCNNSSTGGTYIMTNTKAGNIDYSQTCTIQGTSCSIKAYLDTNITNMMSSMVDQAVALLNPIGVSVASISSTNQEINVNENIYNSMTQLISNNCVNAVNNTQANNYYYYNNDTLGNITYAQVGTISNADCVMDTVVKATAKNTQSSGAGQKSGCTGSYGGGGGGSLLYIGIFVLIIFVIIAVLAFMAKKKAASVLGPGGFDGLQRSFKQAGGVQGILNAGSQNLNRGALNSRPAPRALAA